MCTATKAVVKVFLSAYRERCCFFIMEWAARFIVIGALLLEVRYPLTNDVSNVSTRNYIFNKGFWYHANILLKVQSWCGHYTQQKVSPLSVNEKGILQYASKVF